MSDRTGQLQAQVSRGVAAQRALEVAEPYLMASRTALIEAWTREGDPALRHEAWHAVRAHDAILNTIRADIASGQAAQSELRYLAQQENANG